MIFTISFGQSQFQKKYESSNGSRGYSIKQTTDGGYVLAGSYDVAGFFSAEFYVVKLDVFGDTTWANTYGQKVDTAIAANRDGTGNVAHNIIQTFDLGYLIVGEAHATDTGQPGIFSLKLDQNGDTSWSKLYGGTLSDYAYKVVQLEDSGYIISGYTESYGLGIRNMYLIRIDQFGDTLWGKSYGGNSIDGSADIVQTYDGGFVIVGNTFSFGAGGSDVYVIKIDKDGTIKWEYAYGGALNDFGLSICQSVDSGFLISGSTESFGAGQRDFYVLKIDSIGNLNWSKVFGGTGNETGKSIIELDNKDVVVFGNTGSFGRGSDDFYFIKLNSLGDTIMTRNYGGLSIDIGEEIHQTSDKGFIMAGYTNSFNTWSFDAYIVKVDSSGNSGCHQSNTLTQVVTPTSIRTSTNSVITNGIQINDLGVKIGKTLSKAINTCNINSTEEIINKRVITVFPNPTSGIISISFNSEDVDYISKASIIDINGKIIQTKIISNEINQIDISSYQNGFYFLRIETDLGSITKKIIKQ